MTQNQFYALSLSERLSKAGISNEFHHAVKNRNSTAIQQYLLRLGYAADAAAAMAKTFVENPTAFTE